MGAGLEGWQVAGAGGQFEADDAIGAGPFALDHDGHGIAARHGDVGHGGEFGRDLLKGWVQRRGRGFFRGDAFEAVAELGQGLVVVAQRRQVGLGGQQAADDRAAGIDGLDEIVGAAEAQSETGQEIGRLVIGGEGCQRREYVFGGGIDRNGAQGEPVMALGAGEGAERLFVIG